MENNTRIHAIIKGRVQGVFFRSETRKQAEARGVTGWVRNLPDGSVEAVFEGKPEAVEKVVKWCQQGPPAAQVARVDTSESPASGEFTSFDVTY
ncbi:MAG: acylphosphatase [Desulfosudaceae bacterium]